MHCGQPMGRMRHLGKTSRRQRGFSILELAVVLGIMLVITALATPSIVNTVADLKFRTAASDAAGIVQRARFLAVHDNTYYALRPTVDAGSVTWLWVDLDGDANRGAGEPALAMPRNITQTFGGYPALSDATVGFKQQTVNTVVRFNSRGLPCVMNGSVCSSYDAGGSPVGFSMFLEQTRTLGGPQYYALAISPAGRVRIWSYTGGAWQ